MHLPKVLKSIYQEHGCDFQRLVATLINLDVPLEDVALLSQMPWQLPANRIAVERARLGLPPVQIMHPQQCSRCVCRIRSLHTRQKFIRRSSRSTDPAKRGWASI